MHIFQELRTPLNGVLGMAEILRETDPLPSQKVQKVFFVDNDT